MKCPCFSVLYCPVYVEAVQEILYGNRSEGLIRETNGQHSIKTTCSCSCYHFTKEIYVADGTEVFVVAVTIQTPVRDVCISNLGQITGYAT